MKEDSTLNTNYPRGTWTSLNEHIYTNAYIYILQVPLNRQFSLVTIWKICHMLSLLFPNKRYQYIIFKYNI